MTDLNALKAANAKRWLNAKLTRNFTTVAGHLVAPDAKVRYQAVAGKTGVPWWFIAVVHERECSQDWTGSLAQGDPINRPSVHVPAGRPAGTWEAVAVDALANCSPHAARNKDWSVGGTLALLEQYNGLGYASRGRPSPYIWSGTDQYVSGKYVRDGVYDPDTVDSQLGCAGLIMAMNALDASVRFEGAVITQQMPPPVPTAPLKDGIWLQNTLNRLGANPKLELDGIVGPDTRNAVRAFQLSQNLVVDGLAGPATFAALDAALAAGKPVPTIPVPPEITLPPPGTQAHADLAPTFWGRVYDLFRPKGAK